MDLLGEKVNVIRTFYRFLGNSKVSLKVQISAIELWRNVQNIRNIFL